VKTYTFRHPGMGNAYAEVAAPEMADLTDRDLRRVVCDFRYRLMIRDTMLTVERFHFSPMVSQTMWATLWRAALEESHYRAAREHTARGFVWTGFCGPRRGPGDDALEIRLAAKRVFPPQTSLGRFLREKLAAAGASDVRPAQRDGVSESIRQDIEGRGNVNPEGHQA